MSHDDPFDPAADPYAPDPPLARRDALRLLVVAPAALAAASGCALRRLACVVPGEVRDGHCEHRFCRYYRG